MWNQDKVFLPFTVNSDAVFSDLHIKKKKIDFYFT